jgi:DNA-binding NarL/FixJ family response regulator
VAIGLPDSEETILQYVEAGIDGYVLRDDSVDELLQKIRAAHKGEAAISSQIAAALMQRVAELKEQCDDEADPESLQTLTPRETEVLDLLQKQLSNQEIADRLVIEVGTVKNHVHSVLKKLNLNSRYDVPGVPASKEIAKKAA